MTPLTATKNYAANIVTSAAPHHTSLHIIDDNIIIESAPFLTAPNTPTTLRKLRRLFLPTLIPPEK